MVVRFVENPVQLRLQPLRMATAYNRQTGRLIAQASRRICPVDRSPYRRPGPHLRTTIRDTTRIVGTTSTVTQIGSMLDHALVAHTGARPHVILPRTPGGRLRFFWTKRGRWVSLPRVSHPGADATNYLTIPLFLIGTQRGYRVVLARTPL